MHHNDTLKRRLTMNKLFSLLCAAALLGGVNIDADLIRKTTRPVGAKTDEIKVTNNTNKNLYVAVYTVDSLGGQDKDKEADIFSNVYLIKPNSYEIMDRQPYKFGVNNNLFFSESLPDLSNSLIVNAPVRKNRL